jgi:putative two-component system response regulator
MTDETILIVEDIDLLREGLREILVNEGFQVITARNGLEALDKISITIPNLILSDITMPVMDGYQFYEAVRERSEMVTIPFIFLTARADPSDMMYARRSGIDDYLTKPINREELVTAVKSRLARFHQIEVVHVQSAYESSLIALANAIEMRDPHSLGHIERVADLTIAMANRLGWNERRLPILRFGAILHDIGKIHIPENVLFKQGSLTEAEWVEIRRHPLTGAEMVRGLPMLAECAPVVRHHHEKWSGGGYPDGLAGKDIPQGARIVAVADSFDAMLMPRPQRPPHTPEQAYQEINDLTGETYDPVVVDVFNQMWEIGQITEIISQH